MASTNKTTNYELSQYIGTDKPTYLTDYNQDMSKIDAGIHAAKSEADTNADSIGTLSSLTTTAKTNLVAAINEVDADVATNTNNIATNTSNIATNTTHIGTLTNLTTSNKTDLVVASNEINAKIGNLSGLNTTTKTSTVAAINEILADFTMSTIKSYDLSSNTDVVRDAGVSASGTITLARNSQGTLFKLYGTFGFQQATPYSKVTLKNTGLDVDDAFTVSMAGVFINANGQFRSRDFNVLANGDIELLGDGSSGSPTTVYYLPCMYFAKDFGDIPTPE